MAQDDVAVTSSSRSKYDSIRSFYIKSYPDHFFLWPVLKQRRLDFTITDLPERDKSLIYRSNNSYALGLGMYLFELGIELAFAVPFGEKTKEIYGESDTRDLQLSLFSKKGGVDLSYQKYSGFYIDDPAIKIPPNAPYPQRPDIDTRNIGLTGNYIFSNKKFSLRSAYNFMERQLRSSGSFVLFASLNGFKTIGDSAILGGVYRNDFGIDSQIKEIKSTTLSIAPGYTYSLIHKGFFVNATLALGPAHNWLFYKSEDGTTRDDIEFTVFFAARVALGYNGDRFFSGLSFTSQGSNAKFDSIQLASSSGIFKILFGFRFREVGILKKRIGDIPKPVGW
ncbi:MAG: hypothetical protein C0490_25630 [Marivirga sp.]|nr:hypothetical protein [Marivirga sp.]